MKFITSLSVISLFLILPSPSKAFDRIYCRADLKGWIITLTDTTQSAVLTPYNQSVTLAEKISEKLILKDLNADTVITIFPWNSLYVRIPNSTKKLYRVTSKEAANGFLIEISDKNGRTNRTLDCSFTF